MSITRLTQALVPTVLAVLVLSGCSTSTPTSTPTPTKTTPANASSCESFAALTMTIVNTINNSTEPANTMWEGLRVKFDAVALTASGTVKDRMLDLSEHWPDMDDVVLFHKFDDMNGKITAVQRACTADGVTATFGTLSDK